MVDRRWIKARFRPSFRAGRTWPAVDPAGSCFSAACELRAARRAARRRPLPARVCRSVRWAGAPVWTRGSQRWRARRAAFFAHEFAEITESRLLRIGGCTSERHISRRVALPFWRSIRERVAACRRVIDQRAQPQDISSQKPVDPSVAKRSFQDWRRIKAGFRTSFGRAKSVFNRSGAVRAAGHATQRRTSLAVSLRRSKPARRQSRPRSPLGLSKRPRSPAPPTQRKCAGPQLVEAGMEF
jgi:hypothetical protein